MKLQWRHIITIADSYGTTRAFIYGPFVMYEYRQLGFMQVKRHFIGTDGKIYRSEEKLISHFNRVAKNNAGK